MGIENDINCSFCRRERDSINHIFWRCVYVKSFWEQFQTTLKTNQKFVLQSQDWARLYRPVLIAWFFTQKLTEPGIPLLLIPNLPGICFDSSPSFSQPAPTSSNTGLITIVQDSEWTTLRASLSGTFLQTLPDLVTPLKGHSLSPRSCPATRSAPSERFRY